ncbi:hypothetical protein [Synechococcus sp. NB0720_010]|uniref:hypothetical protein n=1 Tax=Synechococcus sp. NB0720_010 TaxID=2907159 RepID=UPI001FFAA126|nr:hypothetical protein [Synechococcus sp. NB0720_010]UPH89191.1 hypothetical protein LY254_07715 [Synechococcus sp. NB0720_010]
MSLTLILLKLSPLKKNSALQALSLNRLLVRPLSVLYFQIPLRSIIQYNPDCFSVDPSLVYAPLENSICEQSNVESSVKVSFGIYGARGTNSASQFFHNKDNKPNLVIILGDSHAMGWGVSDTDVFSSHLSNTSLKTLNLAVSSYGTARELIRLRKFAESYPDIYARVTTIILQYSDNDSGENREYIANGFVLPLNQSHLASYANALRSDNGSHLPRGSSLLRLFLARPQLLFLSIKELYWDAYIQVKNLARTLLSASPLSGFFEAKGLINQERTKHAKNFWPIINRYSDLLKGKRVIVFVSNGFGKDNQQITAELDRNRYKKLNRKLESLDIKVVYPASL